MSIGGRLKTIGQIKFFFFVVVVLLYSVIFFSVTSEKTYVLCVLQLHLNHVSPLGEKTATTEKKKAGSVISLILAPYYTACFHFMPV